MFCQLVKITCFCLSLARLIMGLSAADRESIQQTNWWTESSTESSSSSSSRTFAELTEQQAELTWEYEPRVWKPEEPDEDGDADEPSELRQPDEPIESDDGRQIKGATGPDLRENAEKETNFIRDKSYFWDSKRRRHYGKLDVSTRQSATDKCTQFRVDIRETVICDRRRCDKLDFEWPKHNNQMVVMETTKHGMRFHRSEYEFKLAALVRHKSVAVKLGGANSTRISPPVKFDLFELFKPKPTSSPPPIVSSPKYTYLSTTKTTTPATTKEPQQQQTSDEKTTPATTTSMADDTQEGSTESGAEDGQEPSTSSIRDEAQIKAQDNNQTRLVTTFRLSTKRRMQKIIGFGGALSDSTCRNIRSLSPAMARSLMEDYFGPRGLRYNMARMSIGSSDFSNSPYTNNDRAPVAAEEPAKEDDWRRKHAAAPSAYDETADDVEMKNFHLTEEDYEFKLPVARQAIATSQQPIKFYSSLWSPPIWMKNNSHIVHGWLKGDVYGPYYKALAELMVKWHEAYRRQGVEFWATTGLNEPVTGIKPFIFHNSLGITRDDYATFIKLYLGPMLRQRGFKDLKLIVLDDNKGYAPNWANKLLSDKETAKFVAGVGVHWYMNDEYENLNFLSRDHADKFLLSTEACNGYLPFQVHTLPGDWDRGVAYMYDILKLMQKNVAGWVDWNMALDLVGGPSWIKNNLDAPVIVNAERDEYYKSPMFYAIGHFSRFVEPDSYRLDHRLAYANYDYPLQAVAFLTPKNQIVITVLNANKHRVPFKIIVDRQEVRLVDLKADSFSTIMFNWNSRNI